MRVFCVTAFWCPLWVTERWMMLSLRLVSGCQSWTVKHAKPLGSACLPRDGLWPSKLQEGGGGMIVCLMLSRLKQIIPAQLPSAGLWAPKLIFGHIQLAPRDQLAVWFSQSNSWKVHVICGSLFQRLCRIDILITSSVIYRLCDFKI